MCVVEISECASDNVPKIRPPAISFFKVLLHCARMTDNSIVHELSKTGHQRLRRQTHGWRNFASGRSKVMLPGCFVTHNVMPNQTD